MLLLLLMLVAASAAPNASSPAARVDDGLTTLCHAFIEKRALEQPQTCGDMYAECMTKQGECVRNTNFVLDKERSITVIIGTYSISLLLAQFPRMRPLMSWVHIVVTLTAISDFLIVPWIMTGGCFPTPMGDWCPTKTKNSPERIEAFTSLRRWIYTVFFAAITTVVFLALSRRLPTTEGDETVSKKGAKDEEIPDEGEDGVLPRFIWLASPFAAYMVSHFIPQGGNEFNFLVMFITSVFKHAQQLQKTQTPVLSRKEQQKQQQQQQQEEKPSQSVSQRTRKRRISFTGKPG